MEATFNFSIQLRPAISKLFARRLETGILLGLVTMAIFSRTLRRPDITGLDISPVAAI